ncbi:MAG: peptide-methionine (S)-S-oxide reductase, partial [Prosthecobacter sp.]|nr:peptide-methionine (S)-S-oxide reductase [Prosthecobacter sp.]
DAQKQIAEASKTVAQKNWKDPIATEIAPLKKFYPAEDYHQNFKALNPNQGYVRAVVDPKTEKFKHTLEEKGKIKPETK